MSTLNLRRKKSSREEGEVSFVLGVYMPPSSGWDQGKKWNVSPSLRFFLLK